MLAGVCNLYTNKSTVAEMADLFRAEPSRGFNAPQETYPGYPGLVIREQDGERIIEQMAWGFPRHTVNKRTGQPNKPQPVNNLRDDRLWTFWRKQFLDPAARCLIPFTAFAEAEGVKGQMTRTWISVADQPVAAWAGLWKQTDEWGNAYSGVMCDATPELFEIHDWMPVILHPRDHDAWLHAPAEEAMQLVTQYPAAQLVVNRTDQPWFARRPNEGAALP